MAVARASTIATAIRKMKYWFTSETVAAVMFRSIRYRTATGKVSVAPAAIVSASRADASCLLYGFR